MEIALKYVHGGIGKVLPFLTDTDCGNLYFVSRTARALVSSFHRRVPPWSCNQSLIAYELRPVWLNKVLPFLTDTDCGNIYFVCRTARALVSSFSRRVPPWSCRQSLIAYGRKVPTYWSFEKEFAIIMTGHMGAIRLLADPGRGDRNHVAWLRILCGVIELGMLDVLQFLHEEAGGSIDSSALASRAIECGNFDILRYLVENGCDCKVSAPVDAVRAERLDMVRYLHDHGGTFCPNSCTLLAVVSGNSDILRYLNSIGIPNHPSAVELAASYGHVHILRYLVESGRKITKDATSAAAKSGHLHVLRYMYEEAGCVFRDYMLSDIRVQANTEVSRYMSERTTPWMGSDVPMPFASAYAAVVAETNS